MTTRHASAVNRRARIIVYSMILLITGAMLATAITTAIRATTRPHRNSAAAPARTRQLPAGHLADTREER